jgi:hypothetical protein
MICDRCKQKTFVVYIIQPDHEKVCSRECKGKMKTEKKKRIINKYPVLSDDFISRLDLGQKPIFSIIEASGTKSYINDSTIHPNL